MKALRYMLFTMVLALGVLGFTGTTHAFNWVDAKYTYKKVKWNKQTFGDQKESYYYYRIPAVVK